MKKKVSILAGLITMMAVNTALADQVRVLVSNEAALAARFNLIKTAKKEILLEYFEIKNDDTSLKGLALLQEAAKRGVKVKLLIDNMHNELGRENMAAVMNILNSPEATKNIEIKVFNPLSSPNVLKLTYRNHDKLMNVDGEAMIIGGRNVSDSYFGLSKEMNFRDMDVMIKGDSAKEARKYFMDLWDQNPMVKTASLYEHSEDGLDTTKCNYEADIYGCESRAQRARQQIQGSNEKMRTLLVNLNREITFTKDASQLLSNADDVDVQFIFNDPTKVMKKVENKMVDQLFQLIGANVKESLTIVTPYLFPTERAMQALESLSKKGIKIKIVTNSLATTDSELVHAAYLTIKGRLANMGAEVFEYAGKDTLHTKAAIVDAGTSNIISLVGSFNFDRRSSEINREIGVAITGKDRVKVGNRINSAIERVMRDSIQATANGQIINEDKLAALLERNGPEAAELKRQELEKNRGLVKLIPDQI